jgi:2-methylcitrate dehydratase
VVTVKLRGGREAEARVDYPKGHPMNPMSDGEVEDKFKRLTTGLLTKRQQDEVAKMVWSLEELKDVNTLIKALLI